MSSQLFRLLRARRPPTRLLSTSAPQLSNESKSNPGSIFSQLFPSGDAGDARQWRPSRGGGGVNHGLANGELDGIATGNPDGNYTTMDGTGKPELREALAKLSSRDMTDSIIGKKTQEPAMLIVSHAPTALARSDFERIVPRGQHLGSSYAYWNIINVVQARDPKTMEGLDRYFLLFPSSANATAYYEEFWRLRRIQADKLLGSTPTLQSQVEARRLTLAPPEHMTISFKIIRGRQAIRAKFAPGYDVDIFRDSDQPEFDGMVSISLEGDRLTAERLRAFIDEDGEDRHLPWRLKTSWGEGGLQVPVHQPTENYATRRRKKRLAELGLKDDSVPAEEVDSERTEETHALPGYSALFFLSFITNDEARRFAREWHRRKLMFGDHRSRTTIVNTTTLFP